MAKKGTEFNAIVKFGGKTDSSLQRAFSSVSKGVSKLDSGINKALKGAALAATAMAAAFTAAAVKVTKDCIEAGAQFEKQMSNVATLLDGNVKARIDELGDQILDVKRKTKKPIEDLTNGAYQIISAFGDAPDTAQKLEIAAKAAKAGIAETLDAVNLFSAQMKGYGNTSAEFMQQCADMNFQVVKLGQTTFPELAAALPSVVPLAKTMGVTIQEVNGYMATMTGVTGNASEVTTQLASALTALLKPSKEMTKKINALGFADGQAMVKARGLQGSLEILRKTVKTDLEFGKLFGRKEGINFALAATGTLADTVRQKTKAMYEATGSTESAFAKQGDNTIAKWQAISNAIEVAQIEIGQKLNPYLKTLAEKLLPVIEKYLGEAVKQVDIWLPKIEAWLKTVDFEKLWKDTKATFIEVKDTLNEWLPIIRDVGKGLLWFIGIVKGLSIIISTISLITTAVRGLSAAIVFLVTNPVGWVILAIAAIIAIAWLLYENWDEVCAWCKEAWEIFADWIYDVWVEISAWFEEKWYELVSVWDSICADAQSFWDRFCGGCESAWESTKNALATAWDWLCTKWDEITGGISSGWDTTCATLKSAWEGIKGGFVDAWEGMKNACASAIDWIMEKIQPFLAAWEKVKGGISGALAKIGIGGGDDEPEKKARGGFTKGLSICGEAGTEAVISFDPRYRTQNQGYLMTAAEMLGMTAAPASRVEAHSSTYNFGGITFSPVIKTNGGTASTQSIVAQLRAAIPDLADMLEEEMEKRNAHRYA